MPFFATTYRYDDSPAALDASRAEHRAYLSEVSDRGGLLLSGPYVGKDAGALLVFEAADEAGARDIIDQDPFVLAGLVAEINVREWLPVLGRLSAQT